MDGTNAMQLVLAVQLSHPVETSSERTRALVEEGLVPLLDQVEAVDRVPLVLAVGGDLLECLEQDHPDTFQRLLEAVGRRLIEMAAGPIYEPVLAGVPRRDRIGQVRAHGDFVESRMGVRPECGWIPHQVWEAATVDDLVEAGLKSVILLPTVAESHGEESVVRSGWFLTESEGRLLNVLPADESLATRLASGEMDEMLAHLERAAGQIGSGPVVIVSQQGPGMVRGRELARLMKWLAVGSLWQTTSAARAVQAVAPCGRFSLPAVGKTGGAWRLERDRDPAASRLHARLLHASRRLAAHGGPDSAAARQAVYRAQGAAAGTSTGVPTQEQLAASYQHLLAAEIALDGLQGRTDRWVDVVADDFDLDGRPELRLASDRLVAWVDPVDGRGLYELDVRELKQPVLLKDSAGHDGSLAAWLLKPGLTCEEYLSGEGRIGRLATGAGQASWQQGDGLAQLQWAPPETLVGPRLIWRIEIDEQESGTLRLEADLSGLQPGCDYHLAVELPLGMGPPMADCCGYGAEGQRLEWDSPCEVPLGGRVGLIEERVGVDSSVELDPPAPTWLVPGERAGWAIPHWEFRSGPDGEWTIRLRLVFDTSAAQARQLLDWAPRAA